MERIVLHINPETKAGKMLKDLINLLSSKPGVKVEDESPYNPEFVKEIIEARNSKKRYTFKSVEDLWANL